MVTTSLQKLKNPEKTDIATGVEDFGKEKIDALKEAISELNIMTDNRLRLSNDVIDDGERVKMEITNFLEENKIKNPEDPIEAQERSALRRKKVDICELQMNEKINCWRDIAELKRELRDREKELTEKESRLNMLNEILNDEDGVKGGFE